MTDPVTYVYGVVPATASVPAGTTGVGDPPGQLRLVRHEGLAALVSSVASDQPLGRADDLRHHFEVLNRAVVDSAVLPLRFGSVLTDDDAVARELLAPHYDEFADDLSQLDGRVQFTVKGDYDQQSLLLEVLADHPEAVRLRDELRDLPEPAGREQRLALGQLVHQAIAEKRLADTENVASRLEPLAVAVQTREPADDDGAVDIAVLIDAERTKQLTTLCEEMTHALRDRIDIRLLGPLAPYDFVDTPG